MPPSIKDLIKQPTLLASLVGFINPLTVAVTVAGLITYAIISKKSEDEPLPPVEEVLKEPFANRSTTVKALINDDGYKKEIMRQTMSDLGKKSAAARARKKLI